MVDNVTFEILDNYRNNMERPLEELAITLSKFGCKTENLRDHDLVMLANRKLLVLHAMTSTVINKEMLKAIMAD